MTSPSTDMPLWLEAAGTDPVVTYGARLDRLLLDNLVTPGVAHAGDWLVAQRALGANMSVDVAAGAGFIAGTSIASQGKYHGRSTAVVNVTVTAAPASGTRTDLVCAQILDPASDGQTVYGLKLFTVAGADTIGTIPATPANSLVLAQLTVASGAVSIVNSNIADKRVFASTGANDTGWVNMVNSGLASGWTIQDQPMTRRIGKIVYVRGALSNSTFSGGFSSVIAIDPSMPIPAYNCGGSIGGSTSASRSWNMSNVSRAIQLYASASSAAYFNLSPITYLVD